MVQSMERESIEGAMDGASDRSKSNRRSDGSCKRWIREHLMERWMDQAMDEGAIDGAMSGSRHGSGSNRRSDGWCER